MNKISVKNFLFLLIVLVSVPTSLVLLNQKTNFFNRASGTNARLVIDSSKFTGEKTESWRYLAQGGEEKGRQLLPVLSQVKNLRPKYIRIDHIFDYYTPEELDQVIRDITAVGAKPFISLSYMPVGIAKDGNITNEPNNWQDWEILVTRTVEMISGKNRMNIQDVYYEIWNEPDLFGKFKYYGNNNYLELYGHTVRAIQRASNLNNYKVGGPATTAYYENWMDKLISYSIENNLPLDFISWHRYSKDLDVFEDDFNKTLNYQNKELIVSETGSNSENDSVYDNSFGAIHLLALAVTVEGKIDKFFTFEIKDGIGSEKYWGRWGLLTHEKWGTPEAKLRYKSIQFLNNFIGFDPIETTGNGSWVKAFAKRKDNTIKILIVNYDQYGKHTEATPIKVNNLPFTNFNLVRNDFNGQKQTEQVDLGGSNVWETTLYFEPNTATIFELNP